MTTATDRTAPDQAAAGQDFESTVPVAAPAAAVLAALETADAISSWWCPTTGSAAPRGTLVMASRSGSRMVELTVAPAEAGRVSWMVQDAPLTPEWVGTRIAFEVTDGPGGATLRFRHHGLTPQCGCFDMCHEGWTNALGRLVSYVETGEVAPDADSFQSTAVLSASPETVLAALRTIGGVSSWWGPATGSAEADGTLVVSFLGGRQRIVMHVEPAFENRVAWMVQECPLTPDWIGTTIFFDVEEAAAGGGSTLHFRHQGLTPELECFDMCHEGWTHYVASLVSYVETGLGQPYTED